VCETQKNWKLSSISTLPERLARHQAHPECVVAAAWARYSGRGWTAVDRGHHVRWLEEAGIPHEIAPRSEGRFNSRDSVVVYETDATDANPATVLMGAWAPRWAKHVIDLNDWAVRIVGVRKLGRRAFFSEFTPEVRRAILRVRVSMTEEQRKAEDADLRDALDGASAADILGASPGGVTAVVHAWLTEHGYKKTGAGDKSESKDETDDDSE
jgi:hypothetical protein